MRQTKNSPREPITPRDIKKAMIDRDLTIAAIASSIGKSRSAVSIAIHHPSVLPAVRARVLQTLEFSNA